MCKGLRIEQLRVQREIGPARIAWLTNGGIVLLDPLSLYRGELHG
jgi:hypothetical protein